MCSHIHWCMNVCIILFCVALYVTFYTFTLFVLNSILKKVIVITNVCDFHFNFNPCFIPTKFIFVKIIVVRPIVVVLSSCNGGWKSRTPAVRSTQQIGWGAVVVIAGTGWTSCCFCCSLLPFLTKETKNHKKSEHTPPCKRWSLSNSNS